MWEMQKVPCKNTSSCFTRIFQITEGLVKSEQRCEKIFQEPGLSFSRCPSEQTDKLTLDSASCVKSVATHDMLILNRGHTIPHWEQHINPAEPGEFKALCTTGERTQYNQTVKNICGANINLPAGSWFLLGENIYVANRNYILFPFYCLKHTNKLYFSLMTYYSWIFYFTGIYSSIPNL